MSFLIKDTSFNKWWWECYPMWMANMRALHTIRALLSFWSVVLLLRKLLYVKRYLGYLVGLTCVAETAAIYGFLQENSTHVEGFCATLPETETFHQRTVPPKECQPQFPCGQLIHTIRELVKDFEFSVSPPEYPQSYSKLYQSAKRSTTTFPGILRLPTTPPFFPMVRKAHNTEVSTTSFGDSLTSGRFPENCFLSWCCNKSLMVQNKNGEEAKVGFFFSVSGF